MATGSELKQLRADLGEAIGRPLTGANPAKVLELACIRHAVALFCSGRSERGSTVRTFLIRGVILVTLTFSLGGCAAALVGGLLYKSTKSNEEKANFVTNLQKTNLEREKAHLQPLDWCSEAYKFDKGWATENPECSQRVAAYEAGDKTALAQ